MKLKIFSGLEKTLSSNYRISSVDVWRGLAILSVVLYHFNTTLPYGYLGVDLFFVISGLLVGGLLTRPYLKGEQIEFFRFFVRRGFKIWPSYYAFLLFGTLLAMLTYSEANSSQIIPLSDMWRYIFFYQNYTGEPYHWSFDHVWSLCVEEHFYLVLPVAFIVFSRLKVSHKVLFSTVGGVIILGFIAKVFMLYFTNGKDTYAATHNRIDALAWGVLLNLLIQIYNKRLQSLQYPFMLLFLGVAGLIMSVWIDAITDSVFYQKVVFHSITPICFFLMIGGTYFYDFSRLKLLRIAGYYSYNWYLWHPIFVVLMGQYFDASIWSLGIYLAVSFSTAVFFTIALEEPLLRWRKSVFP